MFKLAIAIIALFYSQTSECIDSAEDEIGEAFHLRSYTSMLGISDTVVWRQWIITDNDLNLEEGLWDGVYDWNFVGLTMDERGNKPLHFATVYGASKLVKKMLECGEDADRVNSMRRTALHEVAASTEYDVDPAISRIQWLFSFWNGGKSIDKVREATRHLIERGAGLELRDAWDFTPLFLATTTNNVVCAEMLLKAGAKKGASKKICLNTPLHEAVMRERREILEMMCREGGEEFYQKNNSGKTPMDILFDAPKPNRAIMIPLIRAMRTLDMKNALKALKIFNPVLFEGSFVWPVDNFRKYVKVAVDSYIDIMYEYDALQVPQKSRLTFWKNTKITKASDVRSLEKDLRLSQDLDALYIILRCCYTYEVTVGSVDEAALQTLADFENVFFKRGVDLERALLRRVFQNTYLNSLPGKLSMDLVYSTSLGRHFTKWRTILLLIEMRGEFDVQFLLWEVMKIVADVVPF